MSLLTVSGLTQGFAEKTLYEDANFVLNKEDHMGVTGQNGVGKSTLIKILTGEILPDEGSVKWQNKQPIVPNIWPVKFHKWLTLFRNWARNRNV